MKISKKNLISKYRLFFNFLKEYPIFKTLIIITPLFFTLIVIGEINIILTYVEILKGVGSQEGISEADRTIFSRQALYYLFYSTSSYLALQLISSAFIYYNMKLYRTVIIYYLIKTMNIDKHTYNRMSSGQIKDIIFRRANNIYQIIESVFEKGMYHGIFVLYSLYIVFSKFGFGMFLYTILTLVLFVAVTSFLIKRRNMVKIRYNAAHAKVSADRYNILTNFDIIKSYNREVEDVNTMDKNLFQMAYYGNRSNFLSAISAYSSRIVMVVPSGILYYIILKYDIISTVSTGEDFVAYNGIFCMLKAKLNSFRADLVRIGQYSVDLDSGDYDRMPRDIDNALLYYNYTDNKVNNRDLFTNVETPEHDTDHLVMYNDVGVRIGFNINKNIPLTSSRCISEKTIIIDDFDKNENIETNLNSEKAFVFNDKIIFRDLLVKANHKVLFSEANFTINRGEKVALVGKNGTGKSTLLDVILRFKEYEGVVLVDDRNMKNIYKFDQRSKISYVPQKPGIISGSILDNLRYHDYSIPQNIIEETCSKYGYHELFSNLPHGYNTDVGENGKFLSGGQQQKISFMRGLIKDGDIFIMDEPTANLDSQSEIQVVSQIFQSMNSKTVIAIIHKHSLLSRFDKILGIFNNKIHIYTDYDEFLKDSHLF